MSLQLYQVDQKSFLLDFKSLNTQDHPDAARVKRMTRASMSVTSDSGKNSCACAHCRSLIANVYISYKLPRSAAFNVSTLPRAAVS